MNDRLAIFAEHRARLFGIAYRMLASVEDANDVVQETYLHWHIADATMIRAAEGWLVAVTTRLSIDRLRRVSLEREMYSGDWLPEPIATDAPSNPDRSAGIASDLSMAFLVLLERLAPEERAAFLLREVLNADYDEIARVLDKSPAASRQIVHRARARVRDDHPRFAVTAAARRVLHGSPRVSRFLLGIENKWGEGTRHELAWINGEPAVATYADDQLIITTSIETDGEHITALYRVLNPDKLKHATQPG
jgi:RNA polymerase sigma-70 factor (ECF subfamily)